MILGQLLTDANSAKVIAPECRPNKLTELCQSLVNFSQKDLTDPI